MRDYRQLGARAAKVAFKLEDSHGSIAPTIGGIDSFAGGVVAGHEAPKGRGLAHGLWATGLGGIGQESGRYGGGLVSHLVVAALARSGIVGNPSVLRALLQMGPQIGASLGGMGGVMAGQTIARHGDTK